jgi:hypothetical protein
MDNITLPKLQHSKFMYLIYTSQEIIYVKFLTKVMYHKYTSHEIMNGIFQPLNFIAHCIIANLYEQ